MKSTLALLWREWHEHRSVLIGLAIAVVVLAGVPIPFCAPETIGGQEYPALVAAFAVLGIALCVAPALAGNDIAADGARFLRRLPIAPRAQLGVKLVFLVTCSGAAWALGMAVGLAWQAATVPVIGARGPEGTGVLIAVGAGVIGLWTLAVSCFIPRPLAAIPATAVILAGIGFPLSWLWPREWVQPDTTEVLALAIFALVAPLLSTAVVWSRGIMAGRSGSAASAMAVVVLLSCAGVPWGWSAVRSWQVTHINLDDPSTTLMQVIANGAGTQLWAAGVQGQTFAGVTVDLRTGAWQQVGPAGSNWRLPREVRRSWSVDMCGPHDDVELFTSTATGDARGGRSGDRRIDDLAPMSAERIRASIRKTTPWRDQAGRRVWTVGDHWERETADGGFETCSAPVDNASSLVPCLGGIRSVKTDGVVFSEKTLDVFEPLACRNFTDVVLPEHQVQYVVRPGAWVVAQGANYKAACTWCLFDPDTLATRPAAGLGAHDAVVAALDDGRIVVLRGAVDRRETPHAISIVEPVLGASVDVTAGNGDPLLVWDMRGAVPMYPMVPTRTLSGDLVFQVRQPTSIMMARLDIAAHRLILASGRPVDAEETLRYDELQFLTGLEGDDFLVLVGQRTVERLTFGSDRRVQLFPKPKD